ncbi:HAD-IA family hydrolase [Agromyces subbeticus]|uniref:HAD-IA family hydrolase n=1 Tax=Agromyces subbeticus TaxID=293890 RepID=UPI0003B3AD5E|nr:HAD-IA family hydrolase [Agromyces subbeticus]
MRALGNTIAETIADADIVSFDVFDTLLERIVLRPTDVFGLAKSALEARGRHILPVDWTRARIAAEHACYGDPSVGPDITLDQIYDRLAHDLDLPDDVIDAAKREEIAAELQVLRGRESGRRWFDAAAAAGKRILIVSDMYLAPSTIAEALEAAGYRGWERLIVSGHDKIAKYNGTAYLAIRAEFPGARVVHIGDNAEADVDAARYAGFDAVHLPTVLSRLSGETSALPLSVFKELSSNPGHGPTELAMSLVGAASARRIESRAIAAPEELGYAVLGPVLVAFSQWLHHAAISNGTKRLAFLSREGRLMQRAYEGYLGHNALPTEYVYASRRMVNFAQIRAAVTPGQLEFLVSSGVPLSVIDFVHRFSTDIPLAEIERASMRVGLTATTPIAGYRSAELKSIFRALEPEIVAVAGAEREQVIGYLNAMRLGESGTAVVDIGWQASMQLSFESMINPHLHGFYFGLFDTPATAGRGRIHGFLDARLGGSARRWTEDCVYRGIEVIELLFANPEHPSVSTVHRSDDGWTPVFSSERLNAADTAIVEAIQAAALEFVDDHRELTQVLPERVRQIPLDVAFGLLSSLVNQPTRAQAEVVGALHHDNSLGVVASKLGMPERKRSFYRFRRAQLQREYDAAWWKPGFVENARIAGIRM